MVAVNYFYTCEHYLTAFIVPTRMAPRSHKWPNGLNSCLSCGALPMEISYASRGLCTRCYDRHRRHGTLKNFAFLSASWRSTESNPTLRAVRKIGIVTTAMLVGELPEAIKAWCKNGTPENMLSIMEEALTIIDSEKPEHRAVLFPEEV